MSARTRRLQVGSWTADLRRYQRVSRAPIGVWYFPRAGWRLFFAAPWQGRVSAYGRDWMIAMPARGILTIRPQTTDLVPFAFNGDYSDCNGGSANGINPHGDLEPITVHDRIMQRCPVGRYALESGERILTPVKDYTLESHSALAPFEAPTWPWLRYDGQHLIRAYRVGMMYLSDPIVQMDLTDLLEDARLFWQPYGNQILRGQAEQGHGYLGRSWSWTTYLATVLASRAIDLRFAAFMQRVARHVERPLTYETQRLVRGEFFGSPNPWYDSGADWNTDVRQDFEEYHKITVYQAAGDLERAHMKATQVLARPLKKWIKWDEAIGLGLHAADAAQAWAALGSYARINRERAIVYAQSWPIPHPYNGSHVGPFSDLHDIRAALEAWNQPGKTRAFLQATA